MNEQNRPRRNETTSRKENKSFTHKVGDAVERAGEKISDAGAPRTGSKVREWGDKIEHSRDDER